MSSTGATTIPITLSDSLLCQLFLIEQQLPTTIHDQSEKAYHYQTLKNSLGKGRHLPPRLARLHFFIPQAQLRVNVARSNETNLRLAHMLSIAELNQTKLEEGQISTDYGKVAIQKIRLLTSILLELQAERKIQPRDFAYFLQPIVVMDEELFDTIMEGIELFFEYDYLPAAYILTMQIEDLLRQLVRYHGYPTVEITQAGVTEKPLGRLLKPLKDYVADDIYYYLIWVLKDYRGLNLRNAIAHGFFKKADTHPAIVVALIHILCLVVGSIKKSSQK